LRRTRSSRFRFVTSSVVLSECMPKESARSVIKS
jgi:hypothetical protein